jgi:DNA polymerase I-like protein with 3'-5' exonuclease and polymerase domains
MHHAAFDFWVLVRHLRELHDEQAEAMLWQTADDNRLHDSMVLDMLTLLAESDAYPRPRSLGELASEYAGVILDKEDPHRERFGELIGQNWDTAEAGFFTYAAKDTVATSLVYPLVRKRARQAIEALGTVVDVRADARERFGLLTEAVQVKKAIALAQIERTGIAVDLDAVRRLQAELREEVLQTSAQAQAIAPVYKLDAQGAFILSGKTKAPAVNDATLRGTLEKIRQKLEQEMDVSLNMRQTTRGITASVKEWQEHAHLHPFLATWIRAKELSKLLGMLGPLRGQEDQGQEGLRDVRPRYTAMVRTGRTSCSSPNVQQIPRDSAFRELFQARPGHFLLATDYSFIELRTLAAVTSLRYGRSAMAEVIKQGVDPHAHTAAMMLGVPLEEFAKWKNSDEVLESTLPDGKVIAVRKKDRYAEGRQGAKAINFGVPGGLGVASLVSYARSTYKVELSDEEARLQRERLIKEVYPELSLYLAEDAQALLARNLRTGVEAVGADLGDVHLSCVRKILTGNPRRVDGQPYQTTFVQRVWASLARLNRNPKLQERLQEKQASEELARAVCQGGVFTPSGRLRGTVGYSQARNTPFQGLAADGAGLALFELVRQGFHVVAFVHDEVLVELPDEGGYVSEAQVRRVEEILCRAMEQVLGDIPAACESALSVRWSKKAKLIVESGKVRPWRPAEPARPPCGELCQPDTRQNGKQSHAEGSCAPEEHNLPSTGAPDNCPTGTRQLPGC